MAWKDGNPATLIRRWTSATALVTAALVLGSCARSVSIEDLPEIVITANDYLFNAPQSAEGGMVRVTLDNQGEEAHQVELVRVVEGFGPDDILAAIQDRDASAINAMVSYHGGPNEVPPGSSSTVITELEPGSYVLLCFVAGPNGELHVLQGMIGSMEITAPENPQTWEPPDPDFEVSLQDYRFELTGETDEGMHLVRVRNDGTEPHELRIVGGDRAGGGSSTISPGIETWVELTLEPGRYSVVCHVPSDQQDDRLHTELGMSTSITVP